MANLDLSVGLVVGRDLVGAMDIVHPYELPAPQEGAQREIHVLDQRTRLVIHRV